MQNPKESGSVQTGQNKQAKPKKIKKEGKIEKVWQMHEKGTSIKDIAAKTGLSERVVRSYLWRKANPEKYRALLERYLAKRKKKAEEKQSQPDQTK